MSGMRVSTAGHYSRLTHGLGGSLAQVQKLQEQVASGQKIGRLSDDPVGATTGLRLRGEETDWAAYQRSADDALAALGSADAALQRSSSLLRRAQELAVSGVNGAYGPAERAALAEEVAQVRDQLVDTANSKHLGRAVFGGHQAVAWDRESGGWRGDPGAPVSRQVSPAVTVQVNIDGREVFGNGGDTVFAVLTELEAALRDGNNAGMAAAQDRLRVRFEAVTTALGKVGATTNRVTAAVDLGQQVLDQVRAHRSRVEDVDMAEAIMKLNNASTGYQAALAAAARADLPSLANFLR